MKKFNIITLSLLSLLNLSSCGFFFLETNGDPIAPSSEESEEPPISEPEEVSVVDITVSDDNTYEIGDVYDEDKDLTILVTYSDGTTSDTLPEGAILKKHTVYNQNDEEVDITKPFNVPMVCYSSWRVTYEGLVYGTSSNNINFEVRSGFESPNSILESFTVTDHSVIKKDVTYDSIYNYDLEITWKDQGVELFSLSSSNFDPDIFSLTLVKVGGTGDDVKLSNLEANESYVPTLKITKDDVTKTYTFPTFKVYDGGYLLNNPLFSIEDIDISLLNNEINMSYTPAVGDLNILVVPISLYLAPTTSHELSEMDSSIVDKLNKYFFDTSDDTFTSLKEYYETASYGKLNVNGIVAPIYQETEIYTDIASQQIAIDQLQGHKFPVGLYQIFAGALNQAYNTLTDIDWSKFDSNDDGRFDAIHFVTNFKNAEWGSTFWPQFGYKLDGVSVVKNLCEDMITTTLGDSYTFREEVNPIKGSIYAMHTVESLVDPMMAIHEQGHVFGLQDYYDYTDSGSSGRDYVGGADMQSRNVFDWNAFSKFSVGWATPTVIDGSLNSTTIEIGSFAETGEFIIIPSNVDTFNNTAFDEYFLIELFTNHKNNSLSWDSWEEENSVSLGDGGIRLYHVDARIVGTNSSKFLLNEPDCWHEVDNLDPNQEGIDAVIDNHTIGSNNSYDYTSYAGYPYEGYKNYKLLTLIQAGGENTFGSSTSARRNLSQDDLYQSSDVFTFEDAKDFLLKDGVASTMDNGEIFPYKITFVSVNSTSATIKIEKI